MRKNYATQHSTSLKLAMLVAAFTMLAGFFASVPVAAQEITLEVMHRWGGDRHPLLREILDRFEEAHPGVKVVDIEAGVELHQKLVSSWLAGIGPDIAMVNWDSGPRFGMLGNLVSVDEFVKAEGTTIDSMIHPSIAEAIIS